MMWMVGFAGSLFIQSVLQSWFAANALWGANVGWQNEIAIWNLGVLIALAGVLKARAEASVLPGLAVLSVCFAINHAVALVASPSSASHWAGATTNALGVVAYALHVAARRGR